MSTNVASFEIGAPSGAAPGEIPARRLLHQSDATAATSDECEAAPPSLLFSCLSLFQRRRGVYAVGPGSPQWVHGETVTHCPICAVEFGNQHKHVTRRHCRKCGGVFCYTCTYDKAALRTWGDLVGKASKSMHVCTNCYDSCPPPADGLRRCRFCHQRVRVQYFQAHHSVCLEEQYSRAQFAPQQLQHFGVGSSASGSGFHFACPASCSSPPASSSSATRPETASPSPVAVEPPDVSSSCPTPSPSSLATSPDASRPMLSPDVPSASDEARTDRKRPLHPFAVARAATSEVAIADSLQCNICYSAEANAAIIPCGHTVACVRCMERCDNCPVCRKPIERLLRIYRS